MSTPSGPDHPGPDDPDARPDVPLQAPTPLEPELTPTELRVRRRRSSSGSHGSGGSGRSRRRRRRRHGSAPDEPVRHRWYRPRNVIGIPLLVLALVAGGFVFYLNAQLAGIRRAPLLPEFAGATGAGTNLLLVGSESPAGSLRVDRRTMVVQLVHLAADGRTAVVTDFPRDLYLPVMSDDGDAGTKAQEVRRRTLAAIYRRGGVPAMVDVLQDRVGLEIRYVVQVGFGGYVAATDLIGGVDIAMPDGVRHLSGTEALGYADAGGVTSVETGRRHQAWLKAMLRAAVDPAVLLNPVTILRLAHDTSRHLVVDDTLTTGALRGLLWRSRNQRADTIRFLTVPTLRYARRAGVGRVLLPDLRATAQLGALLRADDPVTSFAG